MREDLRHIAIEGPIGVGKSTLARLLAERLGAQLLLEQPHDNPFLARFYAEPARYAMQTQLCFLFQRLEQARALAQPGMFMPRTVSDFMFAKDALFAQLTLSDDEFRLYRQIHQELAPRLPAPDLVIWLRAPADLLLGRIATRGLPMERGIDAGYLERLAAAYAAHFEREPALPVLAVDTEDFHPAARPADLERLLAAIEAFQGPRSALPPAASKPPAYTARPDET